MRTPCDSRVVCRGTGEGDACIHSHKVCQTLLSTPSSSRLSLCNRLWFPLPFPVKCSHARVYESCIIISACRYKRQIRSFRFQSNSKSTVCLFCSASSATGSAHQRDGFLESLEGQHVAGVPGTGTHRPHGDLRVHHRPLPPQVRLRRRRLIQATTALFSLTSAQVLLMHLTHKLRDSFMCQK